MTTYKPITNKYNPDKDDRPALVSIGCEIVTRAMEEYEYGHLIPIKTQIVFLNVPRKIVFTKKGGCDYNTVAALLQKQGYSRAMWCLKSVWEAQPEPDNYI